MKEKKIKDLYNCEYIVSEGKLYPLQRWYNQLIDKTTEEITIADVIRMIRQKEFINLAMSRAINFLKANVFAGELYDGELLEKISEMEVSFLGPYADDLQIIIEDALRNSLTHNWSYEGEEEEFRKVVNVITKMIKK